MVTALITGITGQDGSYLAELLLSKGYRVVGTVRDRSTANFERIQRILDDLHIEESDLRDQEALENLLRRWRPSEFYNLAARASSSQLFEDPILTADINGMAVARILESIRRIDPTIRFCQASSSELFGNATESPQSEKTPFHPRNPYGVAKLFGHWIAVNYRESQNLFCCSSILYNHESPRRGTHFVTRKISQSAARIKAGLQSRLALGDLDARRDWGFAADYVQAMWLTLQQPEAGDFVLATGESRSVRDFCEIAFGHLGLRYEDHVDTSSSDRRRADSVLLVGDPRKAEAVLGWRRSVSFEQLVCMMVDADMERCAGPS